MRAVRFFLPLAVLVAACTDVPSSPSSELTPPLAQAIAQRGVDGSLLNFQFLPPLVKEGGAGDLTNQPGLPVSIEICALDGTLVGDDVDAEADRALTCDASGPVVVFDPDEIYSDVDQYQVSWDSDDATQWEEGQQLVPGIDYRVQAFLGTRRIGYFDARFNEPSGSTSSETLSGVFIGNYGEANVIKFKVGDGVFCEIGSDRELENGGEIIQCAEGLIDWTQGGFVRLDPEQSQPAMGTIIQPGSQTGGSVFVRAERVQLEAGETCIPELDIPTTYCMLISSIPEQFDPTLQPVLFGVCEVGDLSPFVPPLGPGETSLVDKVAESLQIFRKPESYASKPIEALANAELPSYFCPPSLAMSGDGFLGSFARLVRPVTRLVAPQPLVAYDIGRGGEREELGEFSWYAWGIAVDCEGVVPAVHPLVGEALGFVEPTPQLRCTSAGEGVPIKNTRVRFNVTSLGGGSVMPNGPEDSEPPVYPTVAGTTYGDFFDGGSFASPNVSDVYAYTDANGIATPDSWQLGAEGINTLTASVYGGFGDNREPAAHHTTWPVSFGTVDFDVTACTPSVGDRPANFGTATIGGGLDASWACAAQNAYPFEAKLGGKDAANARVLFMNDTENLYLALVIDAEIDPLGIRFDFDNNGVYVSRTGETGNDAFSFDPTETDPNLRYSDEYRSDKCNQSQSGCGERDDSTVDPDTGETYGYGNDGVAAVTVGDGYTVYELSKPMCTGEPVDFCLVPGDFVSWYGTLRIGKGAKANLQFPQFLDFFDIAIAGVSGGS